MSFEPTTLSPDFIELAEEAILHKLVPEDQTPSLETLSNYLEDPVECWNWISRDDIPATTYLLFASESYGYYSFGFYKAKSGKVYVIHAYLNEIKHVYIPSNRVVFMQNISP